MLDESLLGDHVRELLMDLCAVLYDHGYREVSVGTLMRLAGVPDSRAREHDHEFFEITPEIHSRGLGALSGSAPSGVTLH